MGFMTDEQAQGHEANEAHEGNERDEAYVSAGTEVAKRWHARLAKARFFRLAGLLCVGVVVAAYGYSRHDLRARHNRLVAEAENARAESPAAAATMDLLDATIVGLAKSPGADVQEIDRATYDALVAQPGVYFRAVADEVTSVSMIPTAARASRKDQFLACVDLPARTQNDSIVWTTATHYRWRVDLDAVTARMSELESLDYGLRVATRAWLDEVHTTFEAGALRVLEVSSEAARLDPKARPHAVHLAMDAAWAAIVLDELPTGFGELSGPPIVNALRTSRLDDVGPVPHAARIALVDLRAGKTILRLRAQLDARDVDVPNATADASEIHACQAAVAMRLASKL